ncbi:MAG: heavy metal translocating P-type ATPase [Acidobacteria bacterium]|nr:heavy metal translocating P-type ATPase [Acidobacteriota bacterium]
MKQPQSASESSLDFRIRGMDCADECAILRREVGPLVGGGDRLSFDLLRGRMSVTGTDTVSAEAVIQAVARTGMHAETWTDDDDAQGPGDERASRRRRATLTIASGAFGLVALATHAWLAGGLLAALGSEGLGLSNDVPWIARTLYLVSIVSGTWYVLPRAWFAVRTLRPDMNLLMVIAIVGATVIGEWFEAATVAFLFAVSLVLESWSVGRARRAVEALLAIAPDVVRVIEGDGAREIPAKTVPVGSVFLVKPGERVALDGIVRRGRSAVNQAPITGESLPVAKAPESLVYAGTINGDGALEVESTKASGDTTLANIIRMVGQAQTRRAMAERWVDRFARIYTPSVLVLAIAIGVVPPLFGGAWDEWLYRALVLLVIGCPCALVISTPVSIVAALTAAARQGVLIKGGTFVEAPETLRAIAMDKTGTLTEGRPAVVEIVAREGHSERELLAIVAGLEAHSDHPLARAIVAHAVAEGVTPSPASLVRSLPGKGATGTVGDRPYWLGSHRYLEERGAEAPDVHAALEGMASSGRTVVVVGEDSHVCGFIALADPVRPTARETVEHLKRAGIEHVIMLTGDNEPTARSIASQAGISEVRAELLPQDKVRAVEELVDRYGTVAMVGDGVNDAPAMARATIGVAMGAAGSDAAIETADIALMADDLSRLPWLIHHSRRTVGIIKANIAVSIGVKLVFVLLTLGGIASLWAAIAADMGVSLLVIANALRLLRDSA